LKPSDARNNNTKPWQSVGLLLDAARPERPHLLRGGLWLLLAAGLEALGPILGKRYIDAYLLPAHYDLGAMGLLLAAVLLNGWAASWIRYACMPTCWPCPWPSSTRPSPASSSAASPTTPRPSTSCTGRCCT
jgi:hypothetical protein